MSLKDFDKIENVEEEKKDNDKKEKIFIEDVDLKTINHYLENLDELFEIVEKTYVEYVNAKLRYEFKKDKLQTTTNWNEENTLRQANNLPKITTQAQRDSVINLKVGTLQTKMKNCEVKYKFYNKIFGFINNNFELLSKLPKKDENSEK